MGATKLFGKGTNAQGRVRENVAGCNEKKFEVKRGFGYEDGFEVAVT